MKLVKSYIIKYLYIKHKTYIAPNKLRRWSQIMKLRKQEFGRTQEQLLQQYCPNIQIMLAQNSDQKKLFCKQKEENTKRSTALLWKSVMQHL